jgi:hypothetical protein
VGDAADTRVALQQKDNLCGPFHAAGLLRDLGATRWAGEPLDQDLVAMSAGTMLPVRTDGPQVPPGAVSLTDYRHALALVEPEVAGTSAAGLADAIEELSCGALRCVPLSGSWDSDVVERLVQSAGATGARLIANIRSGRLWGSHPPLELLLAWLDGRDLPEPPPEAEWDVGHFVELRSLVGGTDRALVVVRDSYPTLGWMGHHLQPPEIVAAALTRGDGHSGGVLAVLAPERAPQIVALATSLELDTEMWDNGTRR